MDRSALTKKVEDIFSRHKYTILVVVIGLVCMLIPSQQTKETGSESVSISTEPAASMENRLEDVLSNVSGAGKVRILLTEASGEEILYQTDTDTKQDGVNMSVKVTTVIVTDVQRAENGLIKQVNPPIYRGAIILCQGADNLSVRLAIVDAVSNATGLGADKISVLKMK